MMRLAGRAYFGVVKAKKITKKYNVLAIAQKFDLDVKENQS